MNELTDPRHIRLVEWLSTPPADRDPATQAGIAEELGVSPRTIRGWKELEHVRAAWKKRADEIVGDPDKVTEVIERMRLDALDSENTRRHLAAKIYLEAVKAIQPSEKEVEVKITKAELSEWTDERLEALIAEEAARLRADEILTKGI